MLREMPVTAAWSYTLCIKVDQDYFIICGIEGNFLEDLGMENTCSACGYDNPAGAIVLPTPGKCACLWVGVQVMLLAFCRTMELAQERGA